MLPRLHVVRAALLLLAASAGGSWLAAHADEAPAPPSSIAPRRPTVPAAEPGSALDNPIDLILQPYFKQHGIQPPSVVDDRTFARRAYLDVVGLLPTPEEIDAFAADTQADKRRRLIERLLADRAAYAQHLLTFWNDALRNDYQGTGYIDGGRKQITDWLYAALADNMPYDQFVRELISPSPASEGFIKGIVWRGVVNASQTPEIQAAQNISQVFLGINMKCASCHDSFVNDWKLADAYGLAGIFADKPVEMHRCDRPTGEFAPLKFLYPELGSIDAQAPRDERMRQLAQIMTRPENGRLTRTLVNRMWARFFGRGLVEPVDDMDQPAWNRDLLDWLAADLADHGYDVQRAISGMLTSRAYQMPAVGAPDPAQSQFVFRGPLVRRLSAEQFVDCVAALTGVWTRSPAAGLRVSTAPAAAAPGAEPPHDLVRFASAVIDSGAVEIDIDICGARTLWLIVTAGTKGAHYDWADWGEPQLEGPQGVTRLTDLKWKSATTGHGQVQIDKNTNGDPLRLAGKTPAFGIGTHAYSSIAYELPEGVTRFRATAGPDLAAVEKSREGHEVQFQVVTDVHVRGSMAASDPLMTALGRPNREQVVTARPTVATTLEALELTNGQTVDDALQRGAELWLARVPESNDALVERIYRTAFGRRPTPDECAVAIELVGAPATREGVADLLWIVAMSPEFQLIH